ncbi:hypothetical protein CGSSpBS293_06364 [Streptococcus pneumoniae SP-BS293]|nr:hypothetical protein CGSSp14BS292_10789 [Streptococcus pneumoniae SP14-BS292]EFL70686.1 hypothetical protein CGSSpBS293_06364 [Streptococcus pneumoniae SP-BS293]EFL72222.1 hypothetical protein CGSSpBS458_09751 [Streptococcus pneumoniae BS458]EFL75084.1 hypothetical protein CGSSpBS457_09705 [Streptococcus pneumoniae BS457]
MLIPLLIKLNSKKDSIPLPDYYKTIEISQLIG